MSVLSKINESNTLNTFNVILEELEEHSNLFYIIGNLGIPKITTEIKTAAIQFDNKNKTVMFLLNEEFWNSIDLYFKKFVIAHELLHIFYEHGARGGSDHEINNKAMDIVVNHSLVQNYNFDRNQIKDWKKYCWVETLFPNQIVPDNESTEFYISLLTKNKNNDKSNGKGNSPKEGTGEVLDDHNSGSGGTQQDKNEENGQMQQKNEQGNKQNDGGNEEKSDGGTPNWFLEKLAEEMCKSGVNIDDIKESNMPIFSDTELNKFVELEKKKMKEDKNWQHILKKMIRTLKTDEEFNKEQWLVTNRRNMLLSKDLILPQEIDLDETIHNKPLIYFFLDVSGSCISFSQKFFDFVMTLPLKDIDVKFFTFDVRVKEFNHKKPVFQGGGGTNFHILEKYIINSKHRYPDNICVLTDGYAEIMYPKYPKRWLWFLAGITITKNNIDKNSKIINIGDEMKLKGFKYE